MSFFKGNIFKIGFYNFYKSPAYILESIQQDCEDLTDEICPVEEGLILDNHNYTELMNYDQYDTD